MSEKYTPVEGERVRVVLEGEVTYLARHGFSVGDGTANNYITAHAEHVVSVEKIEPPVEVFKKGDTVRSLNSHSYVFTIGRDGYFDHYNGIFNPNSPPFTSRYFERVTLS